MFNKVKVGIMGTGDIAVMMVRTLSQMRGVTCYAVASRTEEKAKEFAQNHKIKVAYGSYEDLCRDPKIDFIYVATPHSAHFENVKLALNNGKHVLCEKAFMLNEKQAKEVFKLAEEKNLLLSEAMWTRFLPLGFKLKEILASNVIGDVNMVTADLSFNISWKDRIQNPELGGGALLDIGIYGLTFASMILGDDVIDITSVCNKNEKGMDLQDVINLKYRSGQMAVVTCSALACGPCCGMIFGTKGHIQVDMINNFESITVFDNTGAKTGFYKKEKQITGYEYEVMSVMNALKEGWLECPEIPHAQSLRIMNMMDFIRKQLDIRFPGEEPEAVTENIDAEAAANAATEAADETDMKVADETSAEAATETENIEKDKSEE